MFNTRKITLILFSLVFLAGCTFLGGLDVVSGSGNPVSQEFDFTDFDALSVENAFQGTVTRGDTYRVVVTVDDNLTDRLDVRQDGGRVTIGFDDTLAIGNATLRYEVEMPALVELELSGASKANITGFASSEPFRAGASGASVIEGNIDSGDVDANASGASTIRLTGAGGNARAEASGASTVDLADFTTADATANASGASTITINTAGRLDAEASGASHVYYVGQPELGDVQESGGSSVEAR